jgi:TPR repeat protein
MKTKETNRRIIRINKQIRTGILTFIVFVVSFAVMQTTAAQDYSKVKLKPVNNKIDLRLESCIRDGNSVTITYYLRNNTGKNYRMLSIGFSTQWCPDNRGEYTAVVDNLGNNYTSSWNDMQYNIYQELAGIKKSGMESYINNVTLPDGVWVKGIYTILKVNSGAKFFQRVNIAFDQYGGGNLCFDSSFGFSNLPIYTQEDITEFKRLEMMKIVQSLTAKAESSDADAQYQLGNIYRNGNGVLKNLQTALEWYRKSAVLGNIQAILAVGDSYRNGEGVSQNNAEALKWYEQAAEKGNADAQALAGGIYFDGGNGITQDKNKAAQYIEKASLAGSAKGKYWMGRLYYMGYSGNSDYAQALSCFSEAANKGDADAQLWAGVMNYNGTGVQNNNTKAAEWFQKSAEQGNHNAEEWLGLCYAMGNGVEQNIDKGVELFEKSVTGGNNQALVGLGYVYFSDQYGRQNLSKAINYWKQAADNNNENGLERMGFAYQNGIGVLKNPQTALEYYEKAANLGNVSAKYQLGNIYKNENNPAKALTWFESAAKDGNADAQYETGLMYYYGKGAVKNLQKAADYIEKAYNSGHKDATKVWNDLQLWKYKGK